MDKSKGSVSRREQLIAKSTEGLDGAAVRILLLFDPPNSLSGFRAADSAFPGLF